MKGNWKHTKDLKNIGSHSMLIQLNTCKKERQRRANENY